MSKADAVAGVLWVGVTAYAVFGGADFGAGFWSLVAGGGDRGRRARALIDWAIGPVWEANHVWLIFVLVVLWTAFGVAFEAIFSTLFIPLSLAALGIVLRGSSFAFRKEVTRLSSQRNFGVAFALSSVLVPYCMGAVAGAIASGRVPAGGQAGDPVTSWINPTSILGGVLAVVVCAYLAGVYLVWDSRRLGDEETAEYFRRRVIVVAIVAGIVAAVGVYVLYHDSRYVFDGLMSRALPLVIVSALCGIASLWLVVRGANRYARVFSMGAVASLIIGWGVAQWPYLLPTSLKVTDAAAPDPTLATILIVFVIAAITILPSLALLYRLDQKGVIQAEAAPIEPA
jgi:cytochrome bd ubiquinol oxidase subunit II